MRAFSLEHARSPVDREQLHRELDLLLDLRDATAPENCPDAAAVNFREVQGKSAAADCAIEIANQILLEVAGWAINDRIGRAISQARGSEDGDAHQNEHAGVAQFATPGGGWVERDASSATVDRMVLRSLLSWSNKSLPPVLADALAEALRAVGFGEVRPLIAPPKRARMRRAYELAPYRLGVLEYSYYLTGMGLRRHVAVDKVCRLFTIAPDTLVSWQRRELPQIYSKQELAETISAARAAGKIAQILQEDPDYANPKKGRAEAFEGTAFWVHEKWCSSERVNSFAAQFREVLSRETTGGEVVEFAPLGGSCPW